jgi:hypothetical protein
MSEHQTNYVSRVHAGEAGGAGVQDVGAGVQEVGGGGAQDTGEGGGDAQGTREAGAGAQGKQKEQQRKMLEQQKQERRRGTVVPNPGPDLNTEVREVRWR